VGFGQFELADLIGVVGGWALIVVVWWLIAVVDNSAR
jgi:hypothetical protein